MSRFGWESIKTDFSIGLNRSYEGSALFPYQCYIEHHYNDPSVYFEVPTCDPLCLCLPFMTCSLLFSSAHVLR